MSRLRPLLAPRSVAVIGASPRPGSLAGAVLRNLVGGGFPGPLWAIHPEGQPVAGIPALVSVHDLPEAPDLVVTGISAERTLETLTPLLDAGTRAVLTLSAGFRETGPAGRQLEDELVAAIRQRDAVLLGPNTVGLHAIIAGSRLDASFSRVRPRPAPVALVTQSGSIGEWILLRLHERGLGASLFAGLGNAADLDSADLLEGIAEYLPEVHDVLLYVETLPEAERLRAACARLLPEVRLHVLLGGRSEAGEHAVGGHTGALASPAHLAEALLRDLGATLPTGLTEAVDFLEASVRNPRFRGNRVGVVTNAGGPAILAVDTLVAAGRDVPRFGEHLRASLKETAPQAAGAENPLDLLAPAGPAEFEEGIRGVADSGEVDGILAVFMHPVVTPGLPVARALARSLGGIDLPRAVCWMGEDAEEAEEILRGAGIPSFPDPDRAARALAGVPTTRRPAPGMLPRQDYANDDFTCFHSSTFPWGDPAVLETWLCGDGIGPPRCLRVESAQEARGAAMTLGMPVVLKRESRDQPHKRRHGLLRFVDRDEDLGAALRALDHPRLSAPWLIQRRHPPGPEVYAGFLHHARLGAFLALGRGGMTVETEAPRWLALPVCPERLAEFVRSVPLGLESGDTERVILLARRLAHLAVEESGVAMAEVNPAIPGSGTLTLLDCRWRPKEKD